jgi:hypothetical protein
VHEWHDSTGWQTKQHSQRYEVWGGVRRLHENRQQSRVASSWESTKKGWEGELASGLKESRDVGCSLVSWWSRNVVKVMSVNLKTIIDLKTTIVSRNQIIKITVWMFPSLACLILFSILEVWNRKVFEKSQNLSIVFASSVFF